MKKRNAAQVVSDAATARLNKLADDAGIDRAVFQQSSKDVTSALDQLRNDNKLTPRQFEALREARREVQDARYALGQASAPMGEHAAQAVARARGEVLLVSDVNALAGRVDVAAVAPGPPPALVIYEGKGGTAGLGSRVVGGVRALQGSSTYLGDILMRDTRVAEQLREYVKSADPTTARMIRNNEFTVRYELVNARPNGRIDVTEFVIDAKTVKPDFGFEGN